MIMEWKQRQTRIASGSAQNRTVLEAVLEDLDAAVERLRVSDDLVRELSTRLLARHDQLRRLRSASDGFRGAA